MFAKVYSAGVVGVDGYLVEVECDTGPGLNSFEVVGLPETAVRESRTRVRSAIGNAGFKFPMKRITINMAPADVPKRGTVYDLPQAVAILASDGLIDPDRLEKTLMLGELSLTGETRPVPGVLPMAICARDKGFEELFVPARNVAEASVVEGLQVYAVNHLDEVVGHLMESKPFEPATPPPPDPDIKSPVDLADVKGQEWVKTALVVAAAGGHNLLMVGSPGSGKTMLARRLSTILPPMTSSSAKTRPTAIFLALAAIRHDGSIHGNRTRHPGRSARNTVILVVPSQNRIGRGGGSD